MSQAAGPGYEVMDSVGQGNWAETPWVAVFDLEITTSAQRGYYVVYLFRGDGESVFLSRNQVTTEVREEFAGSYRQVLKSRAAEARGALAVAGVTGLHEGPIDLGGRGALTRGYQDGNVVSLEYREERMPAEPDAQRHLHRFLELYRLMKAFRQGLLPTGDSDLPEDMPPGAEARRYRWHRRAERNARLARDAKRIHGFTCKACGFNFEDA